MRDRSWFPVALGLALLVPTSLGRPTAQAPRQPARDLPALRWSDALSDALHARSRAPFVDTSGATLLGDARRDATVSVDPHGVETLLREDGRRLRLTVTVEGLDLAPATVSNTVCPPANSGHLDDCAPELRVDRGPVSSWWRGGERLEQGWTVSERPHADTLRVYLGVRGETDGLTATAGAFRADRLSAWDANGVVLAARFEVGDDGLAIVVDADQATWPVTIDPTWEGTLWWAEARAGGAPGAVSSAGFGDVDGDGVVDLVISAVHREVVPSVAWFAVYRGQHGTFSESPDQLVPLPTSDRPWRVTVLGDVNGDGADDVLVAQEQTAVASLWLGGPTLTSAQDLGATGAAWATQGSQRGGDLDGDGLADLIYQTSYVPGADLWWRRGTVTGLGAPIPLGPTTAAPLAVGEFTGDGTTDVVLSGSPPRLVPGGPGGPDLAAAIVLTGVPDDAVEAHAAGDLDGDGVQALVFLTDSSLRVLWQGGAVVSVPVPAGTTVRSAEGDLTGDGVPDLIEFQAQLGRASLLAGAVDGSLTEVPGWEVPYDSATGTVARQPGDLDGDGLPELFVWTPQGPVVLSGASTSGLPLADTDSPRWVWSDRSPRLVPVGDVDADGADDLGVYSPGALGQVPGAGRLDLLSGGPGGPGVVATWTLLGDGIVPPVPRARVGDLTGDGVDDLLIGAGLDRVSPASLVLYPGASGGPSAPVWRLDGAADVRAGDALVSPGDVDGDGLRDLVLTRGQVGASSASFTMELYRGVPGGLETAPSWRSSPFDGQHLSLVAVGDVQGDGYSDVGLVEGAEWRVPEDRRLEILAGGPVPFERTLPAAVPPVDGPRGIAPLGDVDGDGGDDVAVSGQAGGGRETVTRLRGDAAGLLDAGTLLTSPRAREAFGRALTSAGDLDGDGRSELLVDFEGMWRGGQGFALYQGTSGGLQPDPAWVAPRDTLGVQAAGDLDGDGRGDLLVQGAFDGLWFGGDTAPTVASCVGALDGDADGLCAAADTDDADPRRCGDVDRDGCDDCAQGARDPRADGPDQDADGLCDAGDPDRDGDGASDLLDPAPADVNLCGDLDADGCDDCDHGAQSWTLDGVNHDADNVCDLTDPDDDGDGVEDAHDQDPFEPTSCAQDLDGDSCSDCPSGRLDVLADGEDRDGDGLCAAGDAFDGGCLRGAEVLALGDEAFTRLGEAVGTVGDVDGDGLVDVVVTSQGQPFDLSWDWPYQPEVDPRVWLLPSGAGPDVEVFTGDWPATPASGRGDADGDGLDDIVVVSNLYSAYIYGDSYEARGGRLTLIRGDALGSVAWQHAEPRNDFDHSEQSYRAVWLGDVNADGRDDLATTVEVVYTDAHPGGEFQVWFGAEAGFVAGPSWIVPDWFPTGDLDTPWDADGDGHDDLLMVDAEGGLLLTRGDGAGLLPPEPWGAPLPATWLGSVRRADVDGDGRSDVVAGPGCDRRGGGGTSTWVVRFGDAAGLGAGRADQSLSGPECAVWLVSDVDGDDADDLLIAQPYGGQGHADEGLVEVYFGAASGYAPNPDVVFSPDFTGAHLGRSLAIVPSPTGPRLLAGARLPASGLADRGQLLSWPLASLLEVVPEPASLWRSAPDGPLGTTLVATDLNGDGVDDLLLDDGAADGSFHLGRAGGPSPVPTGHAAVLPSTRAAGDVDGDGRGDLLDASSGTTTWFLFGGPRGIATGRTRQEAGELAPAGDLDGDGHPDFVRQVLDVAASVDAEIVVTHARPIGPWVVTTTALVREAPEQQGRVVLHAVGDLDGDGADDLIGVESSVDRPTTLVWLRGTATGVAPTSWTLDVDASLSPSIAAAGDVNGDGFGDLLVGEPSWVESFSLDGVTHTGATRGRVSLFLGGAAGPSASPGWQLLGDAAGGAIGIRMTGAGDLDGDGLEDFVIGADGRWEDGAGVLVFRGDRRGPGARPWWRAPCDLVGARFVAGDFDGDGLHDLALATGAVGDGGRVHLLYGSPAGLLSTSAGPVDTGLIDTGPLADTDAADTDAADTDAADTDPVVVDPPDTDAADTDLGPPTDTDAQAVDTDGADRSTRGCEGCATGSTRGGVGALFVVLAWTRRRRRTAHRVGST